MKKIEITRFQFTLERIGGATVAGNGEGGTTDSPEQWHRAVRMFIVKWWLWWTVAKWCDEGRDGVRDGGAIWLLFACCSVAEQYRRR